MAVPGAHPVTRQLDVVVVVIRVLLKTVRRDFDQGAKAKTAPMPIRTLVDVIIMGFKLQLVLAGDLYIDLDSLDRKSAAQMVAEGQKPQRV